MKALVGAFNQEKSLVGAFSVIVKTDCETDGSSAALIYKVPPVNISICSAGAPPHITNSLLSYTRLPVAKLKIIASVHIHSLQHSTDPAATAKSAILIKEMSQI